MSCAYYSGWLQKNALGEYTAIVDEDMNGFMNSVYGMDKGKGLDTVLFLHHAYMCTFSATGAIKIVEGSNGQSWIKILSVQQGS